MTTHFPAVVAFPPILFASNEGALVEPVFFWFCAILVGLAMLLGVGTAGLVAHCTHRRKNWWLTPIFAFCWVIVFGLAGIALNSYHSYRCQQRYQERISKPFSDRVVPEFDASEIDPPEFDPPVIEEPVPDEPAPEPEEDSR